MQTGYRFIEACALLPMLFVPRDRENTVLCTGAQAETLAADCLRWRDVTTVYLTSAPIRFDPSKAPVFKDKRLIVNPKPPVGSCAAVLTTPGEDPDPYIHALKPDGIICVSRYELSEVQPMLWHLRRLFPRSVVPWREFLPQEIYGALASPKGVPRRYRNPPGGAKRLNESHLRSMLTFAADELPVVFGPASAKTDKVSATKGPING